MSCFGNFILNYNFIELIIVHKKDTLSEKEFHKKKKDYGNVDFLPKSKIVRKSQKHFFPIFLLNCKKLNNLNITFEFPFFDLKHPFGCCIFSFL